MMRVLLKRIYWFDDALEHALAENGIAPLTRAQAFVIANIALGEHKAINIARNLGVSRQAISQLLKQLEARRYITLQDDQSNRRARIARFSSGFKKDGDVCGKVFAEIEQELNRRIGPRRFKHLQEALEAEWGEPPKIGRVKPAGNSSK